MMFSKLSSVLDNFSIRSISGFGFNDLIDILIIAYVAYRLVLWIKETRSWLLLKGFGILLAISVFSYYIPLNTVWWLISNTLSVGLLAVIVLFQPEIRKALEQIGKGKFKSPFVVGEIETAKITSRTLDEIIKALLSMAGVKTGALILIEQDVNLTEVEKTGIPIDAVVSSQLLINIFENKTPLHDGAVMIRYNRIAAATCILPLTAREDVDSALGTRHRAAIGASEASDAFIVVVSEESGGISIAKGGKLHRHLNEQDIRRILAVEQPGAKKSMFKKKMSRKKEGHDLGKNP